MLNRLQIALLPAPNHPSMTKRVWPITLGLLYILTIAILGGLQTRHVLIGLLGFLDAYNPTTRRFLRYFFPFILTGVIYDFMRYFYWELVEGHIHVREPYEYEKMFFGINVNGERLTPNEFWQNNTFAILDFMCGFAYITFVAEYLSCGFILFVKRHYRLLESLGLSFLIVNILGFAVYYIYPAAPPWFITKHGFEPIMRVASDPGGAARFDKLLGTHFFDVMYGQAVDIYGAYPSLHVAYPLLVFWCCLVVKKFRIPSAFFFLLMCFSAVYLNHHYIMDVIQGIALAIAVLIGVRWYQERRDFPNTPITMRNLLLRL